MMTSKEKNDRLQMRKMNGFTRFFVDLPDNSKVEDVIKLKEILEDVEAKESLLIDAAIRYINSDDFKLERYEGPGHRCK